MMGNGTTFPNGTHIWKNLTLQGNGSHYQPPQTTLQTAVIDLGYAFTAICVVMVILRTCIRPLNHERYKIDDFVMIGSMFLLAAITATNPLVISHGNNVDVGPFPNLYPYERARIVVGSKFLFAARTLILTYIWLMKACLLIHYARLTTYTKEHWIIRGTGFILAVTWLVCILTYFLECHPLNLIWQVMDDEPPECAKAVTSVIVMAVTDIGTSLILMAIPVPIITRHVLSTWLLFCIGLAYMVGTFVLILPMVKLIIIFNASLEGLLIWRELQIFALTVLANVPVIQGLHTHAWGHISSFKLGEDGCPPPKFRIQQESSAEDDPMDNIVSRTGRIRHSIMELKERVSRNSEGLQIKATTAFLQESKPGVMDASERNNTPAGMEDIFMGGGPSRGPVGTVTTEAFSEASSRHTTFSAHTMLNQKALKNRFRRVKAVSEVGRGLGEGGADTGAKE